MSRKWLLSILTGLVLTVGGAAGASAAEALPADPGDVTAEALPVDPEPITVEVPGVGSATVEADTEEQSLSVSAETEVAVPEAETKIDQTADAEITPDGASLDLDGDPEAAGEDVPLDDVTDPVEDTVNQVPGQLPQDDSGDSEAAADGGVRPAPAPRPAASGSSQDAGGAGDAPEPRTTTHVPAAISADRAAVRAGIASQPVVPSDVDELAPEVAPPLVAAAPEQPPVEMALPIVDTTPTIPRMLRMLAGLMVLGAAVTWKHVNDQVI